MRWLRILPVLLLLAALLASTAEARRDEAVPVWDPQNANRINVDFWYDDIEGDVSGWSSVDNTAFATPKFHIDTYLACDLPGHTGPNAWWCGELNGTFAGGDGYANSWDHRLGVPATDVAAATYPILTFKGRYDSEAGYDYTYVQALDGGVYIDLNTGYNGSSGGWFDIGAYGFPLDTYDSPATCRFRFLSDGAWSDADGLYDSDGGAFHCDDVKIFDFYGGTEYFFDDVESGGLCVPSVPGAAGDWWHVVEDNCSSWSTPHSWWCGDDGDTSLIPPNLNNSLLTPPVDISEAVTCTLRYYLHAEVPTGEDGWNIEVRFDGGEWQQLHAFYGDFESCDGWGNSGINGDDLTDYLPADEVQLMVTMQTSDDGCGPGAAGGAGINLDDTWFEGVHTDAIEESSWGRIKMFYR